MESHSPTRMANMCCFEFLSNSSGRSKLLNQEWKRTTHSVYRLRCSERAELGQSSLSQSVKLVVFDFDETLTLVTLMTPDGNYLPEQQEWAKQVNFETPWVEGSRCDKLSRLCEELAQGKDGQRRVLACLTRNGNANGVSAVINLLKVADLDRHFAAIWALPHRTSRRCGAYQKSDGNWAFFDPPLSSVGDHKADVLASLVKQPEAFFPQLEHGDEAAIEPVRKLLLEEMVLVDDQRSNFISESGAQVMRYCKVARYDADYRDFGFMRDMGGIGAHDDADYDALRRFVEDPWMCKDTLGVRCQERDFPGRGKRRPVSLVVFDFDETLTMATFMPGNPAFAQKRGWVDKHDSEWTKSDLVLYNFESPYVAGSRLSKLRLLLEALRGKDSKQPRCLAILTRNECGVLAVLNLLTLAGLADLFSAIWTIPARDSIPNGAYKDRAGGWKTFDPPVGLVACHKADVLHHVAAHPRLWFPQLADGGINDGPDLLSLELENIVLVDDERANFRNPEGAQAKVIRYCKVARYDEVYRDCGLLNQMGGIGAHSDKDYETLLSFVEKPWEYPYQTTATEAADGELSAAPALEAHLSERTAKSPPPGSPAPPSRNVSATLLRDTGAEEVEPPKAPRVRKVSSLATLSQAVRNEDQANDEGTAS